MKLNLFIINLFGYYINEDICIYIFKFDEMKKLMNIIENYEKIKKIKKQYDRKLLFKNLVIDHMYEENQIYYNYEFKLIFKQDVKFNLLNIFSKKFDLIKNNNKNIYISIRKLINQINYYDYFNKNKK